MKIYLGAASIPKAGHRPKYPQRVKPIYTDGALTGMKFDSNSMFSNTQLVVFKDVQAIAPISEMLAKYYAIGGAEKDTSQFIGGGGLVGGLIGGIAGMVAASKASKKTFQGCALVFLNSKGHPVLLRLAGDPEDMAQLFAAVPASKHGDHFPPPFDKLQLEQPFEFPSDAANPTTPPPPPLPQPPPPTQNPTTKFFLHIGSEVRGPFTMEQIRGIVAVGAATLDTQCCKEGTQDWRSVSDFV